MAERINKNKLKIGFQLQGLTLRLDSLLPTKALNGATKTSRKYATIQASIKEINLVEPPIVYPAKGGSAKSKQYIILDGHIRVDILKSLGREDVFCLISTDDEGFTYNHKVNRLPAIQEHYMIVRAIKQGVSEDKIAKALNVDVAKIVAQRDLLSGICAEAIELLRDKPINAGAIRLLRRVKPLRQMEIADMLIAAGNFGPFYVNALVLATKAAQLEQAHQPKKSQGVAPEDIARMQREVDVLAESIKEVEGNYGPNMMNLVLARGYLIKLLENSRVKRFLTMHHADIIGEFEKIIEVSSLEA